MVKKSILKFNNISLSEFHNNSGTKKLVSVSGSLMK